MGEEVNITDYDGCGESGYGEEDEDRFKDWVLGLPTGDDLTPLSQQLIPPELASAFSITPEPRRSILDVNRASRTTLSSLRGGSLDCFTVSDNFNVKSISEGKAVRESMVVVEEDGADNTDLTIDGGVLDLRIVRGAEGVEEEEDNCNEDGLAARTLKRPRLVWTPQLHKRFVDVVAHLGIKNAVPKTIMQLMNVEGLTRENVASHLQKYRLYLKRMQGLSNEGPSSADHQLFSSTPAPQPQPQPQPQSGENHTNGHAPMQITVPYPPQMMPMPMLGMAHGHMGMPMNGSSSSNNGGVAPVPYQGYELRHPYSNVMHLGHHVSFKDK